MDDVVYDIRLLGYTSEIFDLAAQDFAALKQELEAQGKSTFTEKDTELIQGMLDTRLSALEQKLNEMEIK
jgi:hypothetical protein